MERIAVDVVLLPDELMMARVIELNRRLVGDCSTELVLNRRDRLPHISLAMGGAARADIAAIRTVLERLAREIPVKLLQVTGIQSPDADARDGSASVLEIARTDELQALHECVMTDMEPFFRYNVTEAMIHDKTVAPLTLEWIRNYRRGASFQCFSPHITIGYGIVASELSFPIPFEVTRLALCHLGNHCTCRSILVSVALH